MKKLVLILPSMMFMLVACASKLTNENLSKIKNGMSEQEVEAVLGEPTHVDESEALSIKGTTYYYKSGGTEVKIVFLNNAVMATDGHFQ